MKIVYVRLWLASFACVVVFLLLVPPVAAMEDMLSVRPGTDPKEGLDFRGKKLFDIQGFALAYALRTEGCDIIRGRITANLIDVNALEAAHVRVPTSLEKALGIRAVSLTPEESREVLGLGWLSFPIPDRVSLFIAQSVKRRSLRPTCLLRTHHDTRITLESDLNTGQPDKRANCIAAERFVQQWDPFIQRTPEQGDTEYIMMVEKAPEKDPRVQALRRELGNEWDIVVQLLPDGRPCLATLAMCRWWAGLEAMRQAPDYEQKRELLLGGFVGAVSQRARTPDMYADLYKRSYDGAISLAFNLRDKPYPNSIMDIPGIGKVPVPAIYFGSFAGWQTGH